MAVPWQLRSDEHSGIVSIDASGLIALEEIEDTVQAIWAHPVYLNHLMVLWDLRGANVNLSSNELEGIAHLNSEQRPALDRSRVAILVDRDLQFGLMRILGVFMPEHELEINVFREESEATSFLLRAHDLDA